MLQSLHPTTMGVGTAFVPFAFCTMMILMGVYVTLPFIHETLKAREPVSAEVENEALRLHGRRRMLRGTDLRAPTH